jgi:curli production assembly/transport component CsgG|tara:strand:- start:262 stop:1098 length:837 start_codon:yes stop_codon:yes gene_type:complete
MYFRRLWNLILIGVLTGCATFAPPRAEDCRLIGIICPEDARVERVTLQKLLDLPVPKQKAVIAVYSFDDLTGQRKPSNKMALFSTAVTQGAENYLIEALRSAGNGEWFVVVERVGLNNLTKERQLIKSTRQTYDGENGNTLKPILFAGIIIEGGIVSYEADIKTGGNGARYLGIGNTNQYRQDDVTVSMRAVLVQTGEVMLSTTVSKTILSAGVSRDVFRFTELGTELVEVETGYTQTEAIGYATRSAIETAVYSLIQEGLEKQLWDFEYSQLSEEVK